MAKVCEIGMFRDKAPPHPNRFRTSCGQGAFESPIIDITALWGIGIWINTLGGTKRECLVRFADKHGVAIRIREQRDRAQRCAVFLVELSRSVNEAHGGFAAIDDCDTLKFALHKGSDSTALSYLVFVRYAA